LFVCRGFDRALAGTIGVGMMQRMAGNMMMSAPVPVTPFQLPRGVRLPASSMSLEVDLLGKTADVRVALARWLRSQSLRFANDFEWRNTELAWVRSGAVPVGGRRCSCLLTFRHPPVDPICSTARLSPPPLQVVIDAPELVDHLHEALHSHVLKMGQTVPVDFRGEKLKVVVRDFEYLDVDGSATAAAGSGGAAKPGAGTAGGFEVGGVKFAQFLRSTEVQLRKAAAAATLKLTGSSSGKGSRLFEKGFNFEALGIGGLNREFEDIFRRAFASRVVSPDIMRKMGQKHVRGMLLYGPPGCGKTLIARQIGKALHARKPKVRACGRGAARGLETLGAVSAVLARGHATASPTPPVLRLPWPLPACADRERPRDPEQVRGPVGGEHSSPVRGGGEGAGGARRRQRPAHHHF
jgi:hypothetical protein